MRLLGNEWNPNDVFVCPVAAVEIEAQYLRSQGEMEKEAGTPRIIFVIAKRRLGNSSIISTIRRQFVPN